MLSLAGPRYPWSVDNRIDSDDANVAREERAIYAIIAVAVTPVLLAVAIQGGVIDSGTTLCLILAVIGVVGFVLGLRRHKPLPPARIHRR